MVKKITLILCFMFLNPLLFANKYVLVNKSSNQIVYGSPTEVSVFQCDNPAGLLGGSGVINWYWVDVSGMTQDEINALANKIYVPSQAIDSLSPNVIDSGGTWQSGQ